MIKQKLTFVFLSTFLLFSFGCSKNEENIIEEGNTQQELGNQSIDEVSLFLEKGDFVSAMDELEKKGGYETLAPEDKNRLIYSYLQEGLYKYKETEYADKVINLLKQEEKTFDSLYQLGFAYEILQKYSQALLYYNQSLQLISDDSQKSIVNNQIGHVYDLQGELEKAYSYYYKAYELDQTNFNSSFNIGRYLMRKGDYNLSEPYFQYALNKNDNALKAEVYYTLSSLQLNLDNPDFDKSIEYAKKAIEVYPDYPMGYTALAKSYYMLNDEKYYSDMEKNLATAIELNENNSYAYELLGWHYFDIGDIEKSYIFFLEAQSKSEFDPILMADEKVMYQKYIDSVIPFLTLFQKIDFENNFESNINYLIDNGYGFLIGEQKKRNNSGIFGEKYEEKLNNFNF